ncbi:hypothetical protein GALMADRAFT_375882 [Galerina marginata CBS 339.88]|uniref:BHLH domain-containing protein n=1 Tax=Galerina marginata (strain CBS 339.88) TaxID=685588 RepID=A0A067TR36_GALM3|nr:hypothetical protein GALMADRAFT_375882 [Galerina marginata CBS 339.88]
MSTASSQMLSMDFDHKSSFPESSFDSSFNYMDSGLDYFQYPPSSPNLGVSVGREFDSAGAEYSHLITSVVLVPQTGAPMDFTSMNPMAEYTYSSSFSAPSPPRSYSPSEGGSVAPQTLAYSELSSDGMPSGRISRGSGSHSPPAVPYAATIPRSHRFNPIAVPANRSSRAATHKRTRSTRSNDDSDDDDDEEFKPGSIAGSNDSSAPRDSRRETVRKQRIESEQRRRDELREGYARLKETLPASNQKASKVSLLDPTSHIKYLEAVKDQLEVRLKGADHEVHRLRTVNEALMLNRAGAAPLASTTFNN